MPKPVYCCKDCRTIVERGLFYDARLPNGDPNPYQGRCRNCGSSKFREGWMQKEYEVAWMQGRCDPDFVRDAEQATRDHPFEDWKPVVFLPTGVSFAGFEDLKK